MEPYPISYIRRLLISLHFLIMPIIQCLSNASYYKSERVHNVLIDNTLPVDALKVILMNI